MKKITALFFFLLFLFSACSNSDKTEFNESNIASYVGEGEMTVIRTLVSSNAFFVEDVFVADHLPVDTQNTIENSNGTFAPVVSDKIKTYADLESMLRSTYVTATADKLLSEGRYTEIDGKLYFNMKFDAATDYSLDWSETESESVINADGNYEITVTLKSRDQLTLVAVKENGNLRLENIYS